MRTAQGTAVLPYASTPAVRTDPATAVQSRFDVRERVAFGALMAVTAALYVWNLSASGWANAFYSAPAQAGGANWTAALFGSLDSSTPVSLPTPPPPPPVLSP